MLGARYYVANVVLCDTWCVETHHAVISGTAESPYRYRVLSAWLAEVLPGEVPQKYIAAHILVLPVMFFALHRWVVKSTRQPLLGYLGIFLFMIYLPLFFEWYAISLYSSIEVVLLALALLSPRPGFRYALLVVVASLNRETNGVLLVLVFSAGTGASFRSGAIFSGQDFTLCSGERSSSVSACPWATPRITRRLSLATLRMLA